MQLDYDNPFWRFSLRLYRLPSIERACLHLQDTTGASVNELLFALWLAQQRFAFTQDWERARQGVRAWQQKYTQSLRAQRRELKRLALELPESPVSSLYQLIQKAELLAEQQEQALLYYCYQQEQGMQKVSQRHGALCTNLLTCFPAHQSIPRPSLEVLLGVTLDGPLVTECAHRILEAYASENV